MTIEALAQAPLILSDASYGAEDPTRRQLAELAQRVGVTIEPQIDVEDVEAAIELAARGLGDTIVVALDRCSRWAGAIPRRLGWVPFDPPVFDTFAFISRRDARLSPATREFLRLARERLTALAEALRSKPPRRRRPGTAA